MNMTDLNPTNHGLPPYDNVARALAFATKAHQGQTRKYTHAPYIVHPIAVAQMVWACGNMGGPAVCAALLHDTIEDCDVTYHDIGGEFGTYVADRVQALTDQADPAWSRATRKAWEAGRLSTCGRVVQTIKCADLHHNTMDIVPYDSGFAKVYLAEKRVVLQGLVRADARLLKATWSQLNAAEGLLNAGDLDMRFKEIETKTVKHVVTGKAQTGYAVIGVYSPCPYAIFFDGEEERIQLNALQDAKDWQTKYAQKYTRIVKVLVSPTGIAITDDFFGV
jgi:hypothetical protein